MSDSERRALQRAGDRIAKLEGSLDVARAEWAALVRRLGISAVARELGVSRQSVSDRVKAAERRHRQ